VHSISFTSSSLWAMGDELAGSRSGSPRLRGWKSEKRFCWPPCSSSFFTSQCAGATPGSPPCAALESRSLPLRPSALDSGPCRERRGSITGSSSRRFSTWRSPWRCAPFHGGRWAAGRGSPGSPSRRSRLFGWGCGSPHSAPSKTPSATAAPPKPGIPRSRSSAGSPPVVRPGRSSWRRTGEWRRRFSVSPTEGPAGSSSPSGTSAGWVYRRSRRRSIARAPSTWSVSAARPGFSLPRLASSARSRPTRRGAQWSRRPRPQAGRRSPCASTSDPARRNRIRG
jgi:hypothetical protein